MISRKSPNSFSKIEHVDIFIFCQNHELTLSLVKSNFANISNLYFHSLKLDLLPRRSHLSISNLRKNRECRFFLKKFPQNQGLTFLENSNFANISDPYFHIAKGLVFYLDTIILKMFYKS